MPRTTHDHERMERLDRRDREREQAAYRRRKAQEDEDTVHDRPTTGLEPNGATTKQEGDSEDLKCERVQDRGLGGDSRRKRGEG